VSFLDNENKQEKSQKLIETMEKLQDLFEKSITLRLLNLKSQILDF